MLTYQDLLQLLLKSPEIRPRGLACREAWGLTVSPLFEAYSAPGRDMMFGRQNDYLYGELAWYLNGERAVSSITKYSSFWEHLADEDGLANSNYGYLTLYQKMPNGMTPAEWCVHCLRKDRYTRQAIALYNSPQYVKETKDFVCTQSQQFLFRNNRLYSHVHIRSSDAIRGLTFDVPWWSLLHRLVANELGMDMGYMKVAIGSAHLYTEHYDVASHMLSAPWTIYRMKTELTLSDAVALKGKWTEQMVREKITFAKYGMTSRPMLSERLHERVQGKYGMTSRPMLSERLHERVQGI